MKTAIGYIRCSTDEQTVDSVPRQRKEIEAWAQANGYHINDFFIDDGVSGTIPLGERPAGSRLMLEIERHRAVQFVIIWEYSRWGRDADSEQIYFWELYLNRHNVKLISLDNPELTFKSAMERGIMRFVQRQTSSQENKSKSLRSYSGGKRNIELGYLNTNTPPFGYVRAAKNIVTGETRPLLPLELVQKHFEKPFLLISTPEAAIMRRIFKMRTDRTSIRKIAQTLNNEGIPSPKGKLWRKNVLNRMISNPVYYGAACWGKTTSSRILAYDNGTQIPRGIRHFLRPTEKSNWQINENAGIPAIVSKELWERANSVCLVEQKSRGKASSSQYLLSGLIFDEASGSAMVGSGGRYYRRKDNSILHKRYYVNNNWHSQGTTNGIKRINAEPLEQKISKIIRDNLLDGKIASSLESILEDHFKEEGDAHSAAREIRSLELQIAEKEKGLANLAKAIQYAADVESLIPSLRAVELEKRVLESRKENLIKRRHEKPQMSTKDIGRFVSGFLMRFEAVFADSPIEQRKVLVQQWVERIEVFEKHGQKKARASMRLIPKTSDGEPVFKDLMLSGPCRT